MSGLSDELSLYVRKIAWLNTKPESKQKLSGEEGTRLERMKANGIIPALPPNPAPYLTDWLFEIGPTVPNGMGPGPIGWHDLTAWQALSGVDLLPWEAKLMRRLSHDFIAEMSAAKKMDCPDPWLPEEETAANREAVSRQIGNAFKAFAAAQRTRNERSPAKRA